MSRRSKTNALRAIIAQRYSVDIVLCLGDSLRQKHSAIISDVIFHSENGSRTRHQQLHNLIDAGIVQIVKEYKHPNNCKHLILTPAGWALYGALDRVIKTLDVRA